MTQFEFESEQAAWEYYLNLDSHHFEEKQHNNIYTDAFEAGAEWEHKRLVEKVSKWIKENTDWTEEYIWDGRNPNYGLWSELKKFLEE